MFSLIVNVHVIVLFCKLKVELLSRKRRQHALLGISFLNCGNYRGDSWLWRNRRGCGRNREAIVLHLPCNLLDYACYGTWETWQKQHLIFVLTDSRRPPHLEVGCFSFEERIKWNTKKNLNLDAS